MIDVNSIRVDRNGHGVYIKTAIMSHRWKQAKSKIKLVKIGYFLKRPDFSAAYATRRQSGTRTRRWTWGQSFPSREAPRSPRAMSTGSASPLLPIWTKTKTRTTAKTKTNHTQNKKTETKVPPPLLSKSHYFLFNPPSTSFLTTQKRQELLQDGWYFRFVL